MAALAQAREEGGILCAETSSSLPICLPVHPSSPVHPSLLLPPGYTMHQPAPAVRHRVRRSCRGVPRQAPGLGSRETAWAGRLPGSREPGSVRNRGDSAQRLTRAYAEKDGKIG